MRISDWSSDVCSSDLGSNAQRLAAALVAAEKSIRTRALWTKYTPRQKEDAGWQLSFHSQLEDALAGGDIWVAFQPQYERSEEHTSELQSLMRTSYAVFCLNKKKHIPPILPSSVHPSKHLSSI